MPRGRGRGWFGRGFGPNPYPFCRFFPWLPRRWWAYQAYGFPYYGTALLPPYSAYEYPLYGYRPYRQW